LPEAHARHGEIVRNFLTAEYNLSQRNPRSQYDNHYDHFVTLGTELFECPEKLFKETEFSGKEFSGLQKYTYKAIMKCDPEIHADLFKNIVLSGGSTMFPGFVERMTEEMEKLTSFPVHVIGHERRDCAAWMGASRLVGKDNFKGTCVKKKDYFTEGLRVVQRLFW